MQECWVDVLNYENYYQVSNLGRVRSVTRKVNNHLYKGKILTPISNGYYLEVGLCKNNIRERIFIHILVAQAFLGFDRNSGLEINHIDHNKLNNIYTNLEIVTHRENILKSIEFYGGTKNMYGKHQLLPNQKSYCVECGQAINKKSIRCRICNQRYIQQTKTYIPPQKLLDEVDKNGICGTAKIYNVSHTTIRRWVNRLK